jgi:hypothetical protein
MLSHRRLLASLAVLALLAPVARAQTIFIGANEYAFQYQPGASATPLGLYFNTTLSRYEFRDIGGAPELWINPQQQRSNFRGRVGINAPTPASALQVIGDARLGGAADQLRVDAAGNLRFAGQATYFVGTDAYAFRADGSLAGLLFNVTENEYQFLDGGGSSVLAVTATGGDAGNTRVGGVLTVDDELLAGGPASLARISAAASNGTQVAAVRGTGLNDQTAGYLGVLGDPSFDGTALDIGGQEIGVLGLALGGVPATDNYGLYGYADGIGLRALHTGGNRADLATGEYALDLLGPSRFVGPAGLDTATIKALYLDNTRDFAPGAVPPLLVGNGTGMRLGLYKNAVQSENALGYALLEINPLGGNVRIAEGGGDVDIATTGAGNVNLALGGGDVNLANLLYTDVAVGKSGVGAPGPGYTWTVRHAPGVGGGNGLAIINALTSTTWHWYAYTTGDLGLFEGDSLRGLFDNVSGNYTVTSDRRLKTAVRDLDGAAEGLARLRPRSYRFRDRGDEQRRYFGFIAQELETVYPDLVHRDPETGLRSVSYTELIPVLVAAWQEDRAQAEALEGRVADLERALADTRAALERLAGCAGCPVAPSAEGPIPAGARLEPPVPNPGDGPVRLAWTVPADGAAWTLQVTDARGAVRFERRLVPGEGRLDAPTADWPAGAYVVTLLREGRAVASRQGQVLR